MFPYVTLFGYKVLSFEVIVHIAAAIALTYFSFQLWKLHIRKWQIALFVFLGFMLRHYMQNMIPGHELEVWNTPPLEYLHGWGFLMIALTVLFIRWFRWPGLKVLDVGAIALMMASSIGRIGCYLNGCSGGKPSDLPWAVVFPGPGVRVHPAQIYMFFLETALWLILLTFNKKWKRFDGQTFWVGMLLYSIYKFGIEFVRTNPVFVLGLTHTQVFSVMFFFGAIVGLWRSSRRFCPHG